MKYYLIVLDPKDHSVISLDSYEDEESRDKGLDYQNRKYAYFGYIFIKHNEVY